VADGVGGTGRLLREARGRPGGDLFAQRPAPPDRPGRRVPAVCLGIFRFNIRTCSVDLAEVGVVLGPQFFPVVDFAVRGRRLSFLKFTFTSNGNQNSWTKTRMCGFLRRQTDEVSIPSSGK